MQGLVFAPAPAAAVPLATAVPSPNHDTTMWVASNPEATNYTVYATEYAADGTLYLGGAFTYVGPPTGGHGIISNDGTGDGMADGTMEGAYPYVDGNVNATVAVGDGSGDFIIGGTFTSVGGVARSNLARINADGTLDTAWTTGADDTVRTLAMDGSYVYAGGSFTTIGGRAYPRLAKMTAADGAVVVGWAPSPDSTVRAIAVTADTVYVGGVFTTIGGASRNNLAALVKTGIGGGTATAWNPNPNSDVIALATNGTYLYVGGDFTSIAATSLSRVAKFTVSTGAVVGTWNPVVSGLVRTIALNPSTTGGTNLVLIGGDFATVDGAARTALAAIVDVNGELYSGIASVTGNVFTITVAPNNVYVGGGFGEISGQPSQKRIARFSNDGNFIHDTTWNPVPLGAYVASIAVSGTNVSVGGDIYSVGAHRRNGIAALDSTGKLKSWYPTGGANGTVMAIEATGNGKLYVAGAFTTIGGSSRNRLAELNPGTAAVMSFNPNAGNTVYDVVSDGTTVWVGGDFATVGGQTRSRIAALDSAGAATAWYAGTGANDTVSTLHLSATNDMIYVGGEFTNIFDVARNHLARIQTASPTVDAGWDPNITGTTVDDMVATSTHLYVGGSFTSVGASARNNLAAVSLSTGVASSAWIPDPNGRVLALARSTAVDVIFVGGEFTQVGGQSRPYATALRPSGDATMLTSWVPKTNGPIRTLAANGTGLVIGEGWTELRSGTADPMDWHAPARFAFDDVAPSGTISINGGAASTTDPNVTVTISITDASPVVTQNFSFNNTSWLPPLNASLSATKDLALPAGDGTKTVYARFTDESGNTRTVSDTIYLGTPPPVVLAPVYRFYNFTNNTHFFTPSLDEANSVIANYAKVFRYEGICYYTNPANNTQPLYRFYNRNSSSHFYTASADEAAHILATWPTIFQLDGQTYAVNPGVVPNSVPVYRFFNKTNGSHFYTASAEEADMVIATWPTIYNFEGPAFWLGQ